MSQAPRRGRRQKAKAASDDVRVRPTKHGWGSRSVWMTVATVCAAVLAFSPALRAPFQFDDTASIPGNTSIRRLWPPSIPLHPPGGGTAVSGRPVVNYSLAINYAINEWLGVDQAPGAGGPSETLGFRIVNLLIHLVCGALLFGIIRRTLRTGRVGDAWAGSAEYVAGAVSCVWLLHPIQTEAVDYLIQRTELMVSGFYLATLYASIRGWDATTRRASLGWYALAITACVLGMGSKEVMISAPLIVILYNRAFRGTSWREVIGLGGVRPWFYAALAVTCVIPVASVVSGARSSTAGFGRGMAWYQYLLSQGWAIPHYVRLLVWPRGFTFDYGQAPVAGWVPVLGLIVLGLCVVATLAAWTRADRWGWFGFLGAWFFLLLAPSSSVVPIRTEIAAERRVYLASAALFVLIVAGIEWLRRRVMERAPNPILGRHRQWALAAIVALLVVLTFQRSRAYADPEVLWRDVAQRVPTNPRGLDNLAAAVLRSGPTRRAEAEALLRQAIAVDSNYLPAWSNLAVVVGDANRPGEAQQLLEHALRINPLYVRGTEQLGILLASTGQDARAIPLLERDVAEAPREEPLLALASAYVGVGRRNDAAEAFRRVLELDPDRTDVMRNLGGVLVEEGKGADALPYLEQAASLEPGSGFGLALLGLAEAELGRRDDAAAAAQAAAARAGGDVDALILAGRAMVVAGREKEAETYLSEAVTLSPSNPEALTRLGDVELALRNPDEAREFLKRALSVDPEYVPALRAMERLGR
jgi:protein O-mannosyl-transferase